MTMPHETPLETELRQALAPQGEPGPELRARIRGAAARPRRRSPRPALIAAVAAVFLLAGTVAYALLNDTDFRRELSADNEMLHFCESEDTIYFTKWSTMGGSQLVCFADKATGVTAPLCGKPECDHTGGGCNAYFDGLSGLAVYEGQLYAADGRGSIWRMNMDGTGRELVRTIDQSILYADGGASGQIWFHRGYAYHLAESTTVTGGTFTQGIKAYAVSITDPDEEPVIILREQYPGKQMISQFHLAEDSLYICVNLWDEEPDAELISGENELLIYRWDITNRRMEIIYDQKDGPINVRNLWSEEDGLLLAGAVELGENSGIGVYWLDFATGQITKQFALDKMWYDVTFTGDRIIATGWDPQPEVLVYRAMDWEGNTLLDGRVDVPVQEEPPEAGDGWDFWSVFTFGADGQDLYGALDHYRGAIDKATDAYQDAESIWFFQLSLQTGESQFIGRYETTFGGQQGE